MLYAKSPFWLSTQAVKHMNSASYDQVTQHSTNLDNTNYLQEYSDILTL